MQPRQIILSTLPGCQKVPRVPRVAREAADAERICGYKTGGIGPFSQTHKIPAVVEEQALVHDLVSVNGGHRGLQVRLQVRDLVSALNAIVAPIVA